MARTHGRCTRGERLRMGFPHGHRKTTTLVAGLRNTGMVAPLVIDGPINGEWFEAYVAQVLVPTLKPGDVVILDNLSSHKRPAARALIEAAGATMVFLPPYSPDFNPIEKAFSKLKAHLRKAADRVWSVGHDWQARPSRRAKRMQKLLQLMRIRSSMKGKCSNFQMDDPPPTVGVEGAMPGAGQVRQDAHLAPLKRSRAGSSKHEIAKSESGTKARPIPGFHVSPSTGTTAIGRPVRPVGMIGKTKCDQDYSARWSAHRSPPSAFHPQPWGPPCSKPN